MAARLHQHALARIDQDHRKVGGGSAGDHVAGVLFVARAVGDDELALLGVEEAIGHVDGDALLALGGKTVDQQREVDLLPLRADLTGIRLQRVQLVLEDHLRIVEQAPDQGGLAIIDAAAGDEAEHRLVLVLHEIGVDVLGNQLVGDIDSFLGGVLHRFSVALSHQKYPCCFLTSMPAPPASLSMARPCRSDVVVSRVSWITSGSVFASLSTAPVSG